VAVGGGYVRTCLVPVCTGWWYLFVWRGVNHHGRGDWSEGREEERKRGEVRGER
jgi:hypothetical protein